MCHVLRRVRSALESGVTDVRCEDFIVSILYIRVMFCVGSALESGATDASCAPPGRDVWMLGCLYYIHVIFSVFTMYLSCSLCW